MPTATGLAHVNLHCVLLSMIHTSCAKTASAKTLCVRQDVSNYVLCIRSRTVPWAKILPAAFLGDPICSLQGTGHAHIHPPQAPYCTSCGPCPALHNHTLPCRWECHVCEHSSEDQLSRRTEQRRMQTSRKSAVGPSHTSPAIAHQPNQCQCQDCLPHCARHRSATALSSQVAATLQKMSRQVPTSGLLSEEAETHRHSGSA